MMQLRVTRTLTRTDRVEIRKRRYRTRAGLRLGGLPLSRGDAIGGSGAEAADTG